MIPGPTLKRIELFRRVPPGTLRALAATGSRLRVRSRESVLLAGSPSTGVWIVEEGLLRAVAHSPSGNPVTVDLLTKDDVFGYLGPFVDGREFTDVEALTAATVIRLEAKRFWALEARQSSITQALRRLTATRVSRLIELRAIATERSDRRVCALLLFLSERLGAKIPATRSTLATLAGLTPESVTRALAPLARREIIALGRGVIEIRDPKRLRLTLDHGGSRR